MESIFQALGDILQLLGKLLLWLAVAFLKLAGFLLSALESLFRAILK